MSAETRIIYVVKTLKVFNEQYFVYIGIISD